MPMKPKVRTKSFSSSKVTVDWLGEEREIEWATYFSRFVLAGILVAEFGSIFAGIKQIDHFSHLGGYFIGIFSAGVLEWKRENQLAIRGSSIQASHESVHEAVDKPDARTREERAAEWTAPPPIMKRN